MPRKPKKLFTWIVHCLDTRKFQSLGMEWANSSKSEFWLPWPRQRCKKWHRNDSAIFLDYVRMQKRFVEGQEPKFVSWKAGFRTALNKEKAISRCIRVDDRGRKLFQILERINSNNVENFGDALSPASDSGYSSISVGQEEFQERQLELTKLYTANDEFNGELLKDDGVGLLDDEVLFMDPNLEESSERLLDLFYPELSDMISDENE